jgi:uncharacterized UBP type Zn finger protein
MDLRVCKKKKKNHKKTPQKKLPATVILQSKMDRLHTQLLGRLKQ